MEKFMSASFKKDSFQELIKIFEDPNTPIGSAYIIIMHAIYALEELSETNIYADILKRYLSQYTIESEEVNGPLMTSFILTPKDHDYFYNKLLNPYAQETRTGFIKDFYVKKSPIADEIDEAIANLTEEGINAILGKVEEDVNPEQEKDETVRTEQSDNERHEMTRTDPVFGIQIEVDYRKGLLQPIFSFIKNWAEQFLMDSNKLLHFYSTFHEYTISPLDNLPKIRDKYCDWLNVRANPQLELVSDLALRFQSCGSSEAACERSISAQRLILTSRRMRSNKDLLDARLTLLKS